MRSLTERDGDHPLRVAIIGSRGYPSTYGGFETFVRRLAPFLADQGHEVTVYCRKDMKVAPGGADPRVKTVVTRGIDSKSLSTLSYGLTAMWHARRQRYDAALVLNVANGYFLPLLRASKIPTVVNVDGLEWLRDKWSWPAKKVFWWGAKMSRRYADRLVVDSVAIGRYWKETFGVDSVFIPYGADIDVEPDPNPVLAVGATPGTYVLVVARLVPENNIELFLDACDLLPADQEVVIVGSAIGWPEIEERIRGLATCRPVRWLGHVSDQRLLAALWKHCAVYFHGHSVGGTNPALLQAMGHGAPVVAVDTVFNREVLGDTGTIVRSDARTIAKCLARSGVDPDNQRLINLEGCEQIRARFSWSSVLGSYESALIH